MTDDTPLVLTPQQVAERLGLRLPTLRRHAVTIEVVTGQPLPRGPHLERLWPESVIERLAEALGMVQRQEAASVEGALRALWSPAVPTPAPALDTPEALRLLIREEVRAVVREELHAALASTPAALAAPGNVELLRLAVRDELEILRVRLHAQPAAAPRPGFLDRLRTLFSG